MVASKSLASPLTRLTQALSVGNLWLSILSLAVQRKVYAYNLPETIGTRFGFTPSRLMVYLVLYKLEAEGLLRSDEDGRRRYYSITPAGRSVLAQGKVLLKTRAAEL